MKIIFFIESLHSGGKERRLVELLKSLHSNKRFCLKLVITKPKIHYRQVENLGIPIEIIERNRKRDLKLFVKFYKIVREFSPDVIHVWSNLAALYTIPTKYLLGIKMINNQIGDAPQIPFRGILNKYLTFPFSDLIISNSYAGLEAYKAPAKKSMVIYNGFDFNRISSLNSNEIMIKKKFNISNNFLVGMVASFTDLKDYSTFIISALDVLSQGYNYVGFICIGAGDSAPYQKMVPQRYKANIHFLGEINKVEELMSICDIGVLSTFSEGISNALMEFKALGKPVITTNTGGNPELVVNNETGYLIPPKSPKRMREKIIELIEDDEKRKLMGFRAKHRIENNFTIDRMTEEFMKVYSKFN